MVYHCGRIPLYNYVIYNHPRERKYRQYKFISPPQKKKRKKIIEKQHKSVASPTDHQPVDSKSPFMSQLEVTNNLSKRSLTHRIHGTGIFTYIYHILPLKTTIHVGKYTRQPWMVWERSLSQQRSRSQNCQEGHRRLFGLLLFFPSPVYAAISLGLRSPKVDKQVFLNTPWKMNGWNLQITHEKKGT